MFNDKQKFTMSSHDMVSGTIAVTGEEIQEAEPLTTKVEREKIVTFHAIYQQQHSENVFIPQLVTEHALSTPDAVALVAGNLVLRYGELHQRSNQVAHYLKSLGVGPNILVGLFVERSLDMVVGLLGILKAGGAYVPLDPTYPAERLAFMLTDARLSILLTQHHLAERLPIQDSIRVCFLDDETSFARQSVTEPVSTLQPSDLAYVIYTSGSTGRPKGVEITHESLLNLIHWHHQAFSVVSSDRATQVASPAFDATGWEVWPYLTAGASIYLLDEDTRTDPLKLRDWLLKQQISISFLPTTLAESILTLEWPTTTPLRYLLTGADTLQLYPPATLPFALINNYGPTEATVVTTSGRVQPTDAPLGLPAIGRPITNMQVYILDEQLQQVPMGSIGELHIGGVGLAKGYLHNPQLTMEKFIPHPFSDEVGARLYKTGDLARYLPDGQIAFEGRTDNQVKIRGYRIETNEIVAALHKHSSIHTCVVIVRENVSGEKQLAAYIMLTPGEAVTQDSLQEMLAQSLPSYMIPALFVIVDTFPLTANGKIDHSSLPDPDETNTLRDTLLSLPTTPIEEKLVGIVAPLLGLSQVGIDENFFMIGGHSLLGTQVIMRVAETFGIELTLRTLFNAPTARELAAEIERLIYLKIEAMSDDEAESLLS